MTQEIERLEAEHLRHVRALIEDMLREHDICAHVTLAGRHRFENFTHVEASWSNLRWEKVPGDPGALNLRLRSKAADYGGDIERQRRDLEYSVGVVRGLAELLATTAIPLLDVAKRFDGATNATHTPWKRDDPRDGRA